MSGAHAPSDTRLPTGFSILVDAKTRRLDERTWMGGHPLHVLRLKRELGASVDPGHLVAGSTLAVTDKVSAAVARRLLDAGMAQPRPQGNRFSTRDVTIVIPAHDRVDSVRRLLDALAGGPPVIVVDDGSNDHMGVAELAGRHGALLVRHEVALGPAAARNAGLALAETPLVCFIDTDCVPRTGWLEPLVAHFDDPRVAAVAPRIAPLVEPVDGGSWVTAYEAARSSLDLGPNEGAVVPRSRISWVPSATLLVRREAAGTGFRPEMAVAEDVDFVWSLHERGWVVRYEPRASVAHDHRTRFGPWASRKAFYGLGAGALAKRHGRLVAPATLTPSGALIGMLLLVQRRRALAAAGVTGCAAASLLARRLPQLPGRHETAARLTAMSIVSAISQLSQLLVRALWPVSAVACLLSARARRATAVAALLDGVLDWHGHRGRLGPLRHLLLHRVDDLAYGLGLWRGAFRSRSVIPLLPDVTFRRRQRQLFWSDRAVTRAACGSSGPGRDPR